MDKSLSLFAKLVLLGAGGLAIVAGPILYLLPRHTDVYFAWTIAQPLTAMFMGASYASGIGNLIAIRADRWSLARVQLPAIIVFSTAMLVATMLHRSIFNWQHPIAWAWLAVYVLSPPAAVAVWLWGEHGFAPPVFPDRRMPALFGPVMIGLTVMGLLVGVALFLFPAVMAPLWPWSLTPLTARVIGGWLVAGAALTGMLARQATLHTTRIGLLANMLTGTLLILGAFWQWSLFDGPVLSRAVYLIFYCFLAGFSLYSWWAASRSRSSAISTPAP